MSWLLVQNEYNFDHVYIIFGCTDIRFIEENEEASPNLRLIFCLDIIKTVITNSQLQIQLHNGLIYTEQGWVNYNYPWDSTRVSSIASVTQYVPPFIHVGLIKLWCTYSLVHCARYADEKFGKAHDIIFIWKLMYLETFSYLSPSRQGHELLGLVVESALNGK